MYIGHKHVYYVKYMQYYTFMHIYTFICVPINKINNYHNNNEQCTHQ